MEYVADLETIETVSFFRSQCFSLRSWQILPSGSILPNAGTAVPSVSHRTDSSQLFINGLREADTPIIDRSRLEIFLDDAFHNYRSLLDVHSFLLENLQTRQIEQHPNVGMISDLVLDAALNWQDAYMEYVTHYPIAKAKVQEEQQRNPRFALFLEVRSGIPRFDSLCLSPHSLLSRS
jgi:hypothetical protein